MAPPRCCREDAVPRVRHRDQFGIAGVLDVHGVADRRLAATVASDLAVVRDGDVVDPLFELSGSGPPALADLDAIEVGADRILERRDEGGR